MKRYQIIALIAVSLLGVLAACNLQKCSDGAVCTAGNTTGPSAILPTPSPSPSASPSASPTPDPCAPPVTAVHLSGPGSVVVASVFEIGVTPVSATGPLEGPYDFCNLKGRNPVVESTSANIRCSGACSGYKPQFLAQAVGPFTIRIRVDNAYADFAGQVTK